MEARDVPEIYRVSERLIGLMTGVAFAIGKRAEINRMLNHEGFKSRGRTCRIRQNGVTDIAIVRNNFAVVAYMFTIVTTETPG